MGDSEKKLLPTSWSPRLVKASMMERMSWVCTNQQKWNQANRWIVRRKTDNLDANILASILFEYNQQ